MNPINLREYVEAKSHMRLSDFYRARVNQDVALREEAVTSSQMAVLLQDGLRAIMFNEFAGYPSTWERFTRRETSDKEMETWIEMGRLGTLTSVGEGNGYPRVRPELLPQRTIRNYKYGDILAVTEEAMKFDRYGMIAQLGADQGQRAAQTLEEAVYTALLTAGSYSHTSADNDVGNNTNATTFSAAGLITAMTTLQTMKDPRSGRYLGIIPDTLIVGPSLQFAAMQLLNSPTIVRTGPAVFQTANVAADVYGTGQVNPFRGLITNLVVSPYIHQLGNQWSWVLGQARRGFIFQEVEPLQILQATGRDAANEEYLESDIFRYRVRVWFGVGFVDDRYWYYSSSSTAPVAA